MTVRWRIYYDDGTTRASWEYTPQDTLGQGVICIVQDDEMAGRVRLSGSDFYVWRDDRWYGVDALGFGLWDYLAQVGLKVVRFGRFVHPEKHRQIMLRAERDVDFQSRSAWHGNEIRLKGE